MAIRRVTAREFQKRFQRIEEPVLVNNGIYFPQVTPELEVIAEHSEGGAISAQKRRDEILKKARKG